MSTSQNSTCRYLGHDRKRTSCGAYRQCQRKDCPVTQRLIDGTWQQTVRKHPSGQSEAEQGLLWDEQTLLAQGLHPRQNEIERDAVHRYYQSLPR